MARIGRPTSVAEAVAAAKADTSQSRINEIFGATTSGALPAVRAAAAAVASQADTNVEGTSGDGSGGIGWLAGPVEVDDPGDDNCGSDANVINGYN